MDNQETIGNSQRSFVIRQGDYDLGLRLSSKQNTPTLFITITNSEAQVFEAQLTDETLPGPISGEFESIKWLYDYCFQERESNLITIDQAHSLIVKKSKEMTSKNFIMKTYRVPTVKKVLSEEMMASTILKKIRSIDLKVSDKSFNDSQQRRIRKIEEDLEELKGIYKRNGGNMDYRFSQTMRDKNVQISSNGKICQKIGTNYNSFVVLQNSLGLKSHKLSLMILKKVNWMSFGIGLKNKIQSVNYINNYAGTQSYSISINKQTFYLGKNNGAHILELNTGDVLLIEVVNSMIIYRKKGAESNAVVLDIEFTEDQWKDSVLFANLHAVGDSLALMT